LAQRRLKDRHGIQLRSLFGRVGAQVRRWHPCRCAGAASAGTTTPTKPRHRGRWVTA
jgi:hypothetical protein